MKVSKDIFKAGIAWRTAFFFVSIATFVAFLLLASNNWSFRYFLLQRGAQRVPATLQVIRLNEGLGADEFLDRMSGSASFVCVYIKMAESTASKPCFNLTIERLQSVDELEYLVNDLSSEFEQVPNDRKSFQYFNYYGDQTHWSMIDANTAMLIFDSDKLSSLKSIVLIDDEVLISSTNSVKGTTLWGHLNPAEVLVNIAISLLERSYITKLDVLPTLAMASVLALLSLLLVSYYPIYIALLFSIITSSLLMLLGAVSIGIVGLLLPVWSWIVALLISFSFNTVVYLRKFQKGTWQIDFEREQLKKLDEMRSNFISLISHDLKTPVAKIHTQLERLLGGEYGVLDSRQNEALRRLLSSGGHLDRSLNTFLLLNRAESGEFRVQKKSHNIQKLIKEAIRDFSELAQEKSICIEDHSQELFLFEFDNALIKEVLYNLMDNAIKYSDSGGRVVVSCYEKENIQVFSPPRDGVIIEVLDSGPGIAPEDRSKIMTKFYRGGPERQSKAHAGASKGSGIGLYLCDFFVKAHEGSLEFFSLCHGEATEGRKIEGLCEQARGTLFRVILPL